VLIDGGLDGQTIRFEGNIGSRGVGSSGIIVSYAGPEWIGVSVEQSCSGRFAGVEALFPSRGVAVLASELAGRPWQAIDLSRLKRHAPAGPRQEAGDAGFRIVGPSRTPVKLPHGLPGLPFGCWPAWQSSSLQRFNRALARQRRNQTLEQFDEPLAGHSNSGDNGERDEPGDEAVFDGSGSALVAQEFPKHSFPLEF
jgi:hypothetical protein